MQPDEIGHVLITSRINNKITLLHKVYNWLIQIIKPVLKKWLHPSPDDGSDQDETAQTLSNFGGQSVLPYPYHVTQLTLDVLAFSKKSYHKNFHWLKWNVSYFDTLKMNAYIFIEGLVTGNSIDHYMASILMTVV